MDVFSSILGMISGLAILMYSIKMVSGGLEAVAGNSLKDLLQKMTGNRVKGVLVGAGVTAMIQSSTATTVMVIGFVNVGLLNLYQALWIIMGANIGTNITSQLIAFDLGKVAPFIALAGAFIVLMTRSKKWRNIGEIVAGLGFIFVGMDLMKTSMAAYSNSPFVVKLFSTLDNPFLGILAGIVFVVITHNSASGIGVLQAIAMASAGTGVLDLNHAMYIIYGLNIGTCITALIVSIGASKMAVRAALMHLTFNVTGTVIFSVLNLFLPVTDWVAMLSPNDVARQFANFHLIFNLGATLILLPLGGLIVKFVYLIVPEKNKDSEGRKYLKYLNESMLSPDLHVGPKAFINALSNEIGRMLEMATTNVTRSLNSVIENSEKIQEEINETEEYVDYLNKEISYYISHSLKFEFEEKDALVISALFKITGNIERMGDHATNIAGYANFLESKKLKLSEMAQAEVKNIIEVTSDSIKVLLNEHPDQVSVKMAKMEQKIDDMTDEYRSHQLERMKTGVCSGDACVIYSEMLTDFERLGDHMLNIAEAASATHITSFGLAHED